MLVNTVVFRLDPAISSQIADALHLVDVEVTIFDEVEPFLNDLRSEPPSIIVLGIEAMELGSFRAILENEEELDRTVIIGVTSDPYDVSLRRGFESCLTDFVLEQRPFDIKRIAIALRSEDAWSGQPLDKGRNLLVDDDLGRRKSLGRMMRLSGFDVEFASSAEDLNQRLDQGRDYSVVVASETLMTVETLDSCISDHCVRPVSWLLYGNERLQCKIMGKGAKELSASRQVTPDLILFTIQEIANLPLKDMRSSKRIQYLTPVQFRMGSDDEGVWAFSRDLSLNGMFIRTLIPPPKDSVVRLSFRPPTADGMAEVGARVMWRREYSSPSNPMRPAGMGVQFVNPSGPDKAAIEAGYEELLRMDARNQQAG